MGGTTVGGPFKKGGPIAPGTASARATFFEEGETKWERYALVSSLGQRPLTERPPVSKETAAWARGVTPEQAPPAEMPSEWERGFARRHRPAFACPRPRGAALGEGRNITPRDMHRVRLPTMDILKVRDHRVCNHPVEPPRM